MYYDDDEDELERTAEFCYNTAMNNISQGLMAACVPVIHEGEPAVFTAGVQLDDPYSLLPPVIYPPVAEQLPRPDACMVSIAIISRARRQARLLGAEVDD